MTEEDVSSEAMGHFLISGRHANVNTKLFFVGCRCVERLWNHVGRVFIAKEGQVLQSKIILIALRAFVFKDHFHKKGISTIFGVSSFK